MVVALEALRKQLSITKPIRSLTSQQFSGTVHNARAARTSSVLAMSLFCSVWIF
jgi:hypothetical protein